MPLREVAGHRALKRLIARAVDRASLPPSLLLVGPDGIGKRLVATAVAQTFNCGDRQRADASASTVELAVDACGHCPSCERIRRGVHPDVSVLVPGDTDTITIDAVRHAVGQARYRPFEGRRRVVIIDAADRLVAQAQNALLKTLEEPPDASQFVLISSRPDTLLATVRSRCQRLTFGPLGTSEVAGVLERSHGLEPPAARTVAASSGGSVGRALELASGEWSDAREAAVSLLETVAGATTMSARLEGAKALLGGKKTGRSGPGGQRQVLVRRLVALATLLRDAALVAGGGDRSALVNGDRPDQLDQLATVFGLRRDIDAFGIVDEAIAAAQGNASPKVVADWVACRL